MAADKTNAMRALDRAGVEYAVYHYDPEIKTAQGVAGAVGVPAERVFKTLVMQRDGGRPFLIMVPGDREVDRKLLARALGTRSVQMVPRAEAERLTGLLTGGIGALALLDRGFETLLDAHATEFDRILVNAGRRGLNLELAVDALIALTRAEVVAAC